MITIRMFNQKWRLKIESEEFEFDRDVDLLAEVEKIVELKDKHGRIK